MSLDKVDALENRITKIVELVTNLKEEKNRLSAEVSRLQAEKCSSSNRNRSR